MITIINEASRNLLDYPAPVSRTYRGIPIDLLERMFQRLLTNRNNCCGPLCGLVAPTYLDIAITAMYYFTGVGCIVLYRGAAGYYVESIGHDRSLTLTHWPHPEPTA